MDLNRRYAQHLSGDGAKWTRLHKPVRIYDIYSEDAGLALENEITLKYIARYGSDHVKGGSYCGNAPSKKPRQSLKEITNDASLNETDSTGKDTSSTC